MKFVFILSLLISCVIGDLTCESNQVYVKVTKKSGSNYVSEESFEIYNGNTRVAVSPVAVKNELRASEYCLSASTNSQYTFKLKDSYGDSWNLGSWVMVQGEYGNVVFKNFMIDDDEDVYPLSLYYAIKKAQDWKVEYGQSSIAADWFAASFSDSNWKTVNLGAPAETTSGTQYFRKTFTGINDMAAYELEINYKYGVIAYVNGVEVFRDNMPNGAVTPSTLSSGSYQEVGYHGVVRPASEITSSSILAIELHLLTADCQTTIDLDAYIATIATTVSGEKCYIYGSSVTISANGGSFPEQIFNFKKSDSFDLYTTSLPMNVNYEFTGPRPFVNSIRVWPYTYQNFAPRTFKWQGKMDTTTTTWTDIINVSDAIYNPQEFKSFSGYFNSNIYKSYRLNLIAGAPGSDLYAYEVQPLICATSIPTTIEFEKNPFTFYAKYETVTITPKISEFKSCTVSPALPEGLTLDANTCTITGHVMNTMASTAYTLTSTMGTKTISGTFNLEIIECSGTLVNIIRQYKYNAYLESYVIKDDVTKQTVHEVTSNSGQVNDETVTTLLCLTGTRYEITVSGLGGWWTTGSYVYVRALLPSDDYETLIRVRRDNALGLPNTVAFHAQYNIKPVSQWYYKMGEVPSNWYNSETAGWTQGTMGSYPESSNQIQLYKQTFNIATLHKASGLVISLRYKYGCIIYLNGHEAFRNGVTGDLTTSSTAETVYNTVKYRQISLPIKTMVIGETPAVDYIVQGTNTIAIALVAINANQKASVFDGAIHLMAEGYVSRSFDYTANESSFMYGSYDEICDLQLNSMIYYYYCDNNYVTVTFNNDRREWLSSIVLYLHHQQSTKQPRQFVVKARNGNDEWTTLKTVTGLTWSLKGQNKKLWFENNKAYNQYRFENFSRNDPDDCEWQFSSIDLISDCTAVTIPELTYPATLDIYKDIEMGEVYSNSAYYYDFTINPALPAGIVLDTNTGMISGTATEQKAATTHTLTAKKFGGGTKTLTMTVSVSICTGGKGLVTLVAKTDSYPTEGSYKVYTGKDTSGEVVASIDFFKAANALNYGDFCLPHNIYTVEVKDSFGDGWQYEAGFYLTVDLGEMVIETSSVPSQTGGTTVTKRFTTNFPFQIEFDDWKLLNTGNAAGEGWNTINFDDAAWEVKKAADLGAHVGTTAYLRREVNIPDLADYHVLNVRVKYAGGVAVYFNGRKVARFNLAENFDELTEAAAVHDASTFSKFHIVLSTVGAVAGKNIIAFEIHRNKAESNIIFDATGIFAVSDCSVVVDTYSKIEGDVDVPNSLFDLKPQTTALIDNKVGSKVEWIVENLEGSKFNSFGIESKSVLSDIGFSVYGRWKNTEDYISSIAEVGQSLVNRERATWPIEVGIAGFNEFKFEIDASPMYSISTYSFVMEYCKPTGTGICEGEGDYPSVGDGQISPGPCPDGMRGYSFRKCEGGKFGEVSNEKCVYKIPEELTYDKQNYIFVKDTEVTTGKPSYVNIITEFYVQDGTLPEGLTLDKQTGIISGKPTTVSDSVVFTIRGANPVGETLTTVSISVRKGKCPPEGVFDTTPVGEIFVYNCAEQGSYVGTQKRACILGKKDGEWQKATGYCMPVVAIVIIVVVAILIIAIAILLIIRSRKTKAVGGVKGKSAKSKNSKKTMSKKTSTKAVKV